jgi:hypothetical protein
MMTREKKIGQALLYIALVFMLGGIIGNRFTKVVGDVVAMFGMITCGVLLLLDKEQK